MLYVLTRITEGYLVALLYTKAFIREGVICYEKIYDCCNFSGFTC